MYINERKGTTMQYAVKQYATKLLTVLALSAVAFSPAAAQDRAVTVSARSGGFNAITDLDDAGARSFGSTGYSVGGGVSVDLHRFVAVRADFTYARNELEQDGAGTGTDLNRFFYEAALQLQYPTSFGLMPYVYAGGGAVTLHEVGTSGENKTKPTAAFGLGLNYTVPRSNIGFFVEGRSWLYKPSEASGALAGVDKTQYEVTWTGGVSYRLPL
jgi:opacity protein-like surface antigen